MITRKTVTASLCLVLLATPLPALACGPRDADALKTASLQQRLTVAALTCRAAGSDYNRFVLANRDALRRADADLKAYFIAREGERGEAAYDSYKTKAANLAARGPAKDTDAFCAAAATEFAALASDGLELALVAEPMDAACRAPVLARNAAPVKVAMADAPMDAGAALPALPYSAAPPPVARMMPADDIAPEDIIPREEYEQPVRAAYVRQDDGAPPRPAAAMRRSERYWYYRGYYGRSR